MKAKHGVLGLGLALGAVALLHVHTRAQVVLDPPIVINSNTLRLMVKGPTTNIRYDLYGTNTLGVARSSWPLLVTG